MIVHNRSLNLPPARNGSSEEDELRAPSEIDIGSLLVFIGID